MIEITKQVLHNISEIEYIEYRNSIAEMLIQGFPDQFSCVQYTREYVDSARRDLIEFGHVEEAELSYWCLFAATFKDTQFYKINDINLYLVEEGEGKLGKMYSVTKNKLVQLVTDAKEATSCQ